MVAVIVVSLLFVIVLIIGVVAFCVMKKKKRMNRGGRDMLDCGRAVCFFLCFLYSTASQ